MEQASPEASPGPEVSPAFGDGHDAIAPPRFMRYLLARGVITEQALAEVMEQATTGAADQAAQLLIQHGIVSEREVTEARAASVGVPFAVLHKNMVQADAVRLLDPVFMDTHEVLPLTAAEGWLTLAMSRFTDVYLIETVERLSGMRVQALAGTGTNIREIREGVLAELGDAASVRRTVDKDAQDLHSLVGEIDADALTVVQQEQRDTDVDLEAAASDSPVIKLVNHIIQHAVERHASDIHIEPSEETFRARYRVDGDLVEAVRPNARLLPAVVSRIKIMAGMDISERRLPQDGAMTVLLGSRPIDLRVSTMTTRHGEKVVLRIADRDAAIQGMDELGMCPRMLESFHAIIREPHGIVLVTGPTGSGKTTTLYAALREIMTDSRNVSTIEDPVERRLLGANQFQIDPPAGFTFARAMRAMLRQDPDVVMLGEIRDTETARLATEAALTGHLVLSTLHTNDAPTALPRLVNMGVEPYLAAASLRGVLAQRLVRRNCPYCRKIVRLSPTARALLARVSGGPCTIDVSATGRGCGRCSGTGAAGRIGIFELLTLDEALLASASQHPDLAEIRRRMRERELPTLFDDGFEKVRSGQIRIESLLRVISAASSEHITTSPKSTPPHAA